MTLWRNLTPPFVYKVNFRAVSATIGSDVLVSWSAQSLPYSASIVLLYKAPSNLFSTPCPFASRLGLWPPSGPGVERHSCYLFQIIKFGFRTLLVLMHSNKGSSGPVASRVIVAIGSHGEVR